MEMKDIIEALAYLDQNKPEAAANLIRVAYDKAPGDWELARLANMISPCGMIAEAREWLLRLKFDHFNPALA